MRLKIDDMNIARVRLHHTFLPCIKLISFFSQLISMSIHNNTQTLIAYVNEPKLPY